MTHCKAGNNKIHPHQGDSWARKGQQVQIQIRLPDVMFIFIFLYSTLVIKVISHDNDE